MGGTEGREGKGKEGRLDGGGRGGRKGRDEGKGLGGGTGAPSHMTSLRHSPASIAAAEKRPLSHQTPQSVHTPHGSKLWCTDLAIDNALRG